MKLVPIVAYIDAVRANRGLEDELEHNNTNANIYLATQDPRPMAEFQDAAPPASNWTICYVADLQEESCLQREPENGKQKRNWQDNPVWSPWARNGSERICLDNSKQLVLTTEQRVTGAS